MLATAPDIPTCPKCGWAGKTDEEDGWQVEPVWSGPSYVAKKVDTEEHLEWACFRCDYAITGPCLDEGSQATTS